MILFCEDCGQKNDSRTGITNGRAVFVCSSCGYQNNYLLSPSRQSESQSDRDLFSAVQQDGRMVGAFMYDVKKGVTKAGMPVQLQSEDIQNLGKRLSRGFEKGLVALPRLCSMTVLIADKYFFVTRQNHGLYLILVANTPDLPEHFSRYIVQ